MHGANDVKIVLDSKTARSTRSSEVLPAVGTGAADAKEALSISVI
jgi:hypothetical protein